MKKHILPALRAHPAVVDDLRDKMPVGYYRTFAEVRNLLRLDNETLLDKSEILAALRYLESRGEVTQDRQWYKLLTPPKHSSTAIGGSTRSAAPVTLHDKLETYDKDGKTHGQV